MRINYHIILRNCDQIFGMYTEGICCNFRVVIILILSKSSEWRNDNCQFEPPFFRVKI